VVGIGEQRVWVAGEREALSRDVLSRRPGDYDALKGLAIALLAQAKDIAKAAQDKDKAAQDKAAQDKDKDIAKNKDKESSEAGADRDTDADTHTHTHTDTDTHTVTDPESAAGMEEEAIVSLR
jgi:ABC-type Zn2+ transport system substrate-binding protein/surface adhesin